MKYLCLVYGEESALRKMDDAHCLDFDESIRKSGHCISSEALESTSTATTVRVRNGKLSITDGPFAETKEQLGGFYVLDVKDLDEAIEWAAKIPGAQRGSIEIRPVMVFDEAGNIVEEAA